jgi:hypothetical protein
MKNTTTKGGETMSKTLTKTYRKGSGYEKAMTLARKLQQRKPLPSLPWFITRFNRVYRRGIAAARATVYVISNPDQRSNRKTSKKVEVPGGVKLEYVTATN